MSNVLRRLRKLEAQLTDRSGYARHSEAWFEHWAERYGRFLATRDGEAIKGMALAWIDDMLARYRRGAAQGEISPLTFSRF
jgi:hypothetical protein